MRFTDLWDTVKQCQPHPNCITIEPVKNSKEFVAISHDFCGAVAYGSEEDLRDYFIDPRTDYDSVDYRESFTRDMREEFDRVFSE